MENLAISRKINIFPFQNYRIFTPTDDIIAEMKMNRTAIIRRNYLHYVKKYNRFEK